jgi:hypothetical protein
MSVLNISNSMKLHTFLKNGLWMLVAPAIVCGGVLPSSREIATPAANSYVFVSNATYFASATTNYMKRGANLTGVSDSKKGTVSLWINFKSDTTSDSVWQCNEYASRGITLMRDSSKVRLLGANAATTVILNVSSVQNYKSTNGWVHFALSWDLSSAGSFKGYTNGVAGFSVPATYVNDTIDYTLGEFTFGGDGQGFNRLDAELSEVWIKFGVNLDWSNAAVMAKFRDNATGKPVSLGVDGSLPGYTPDVYLHNPYNTFQNNVGTGGNFTVTGALTAGTPP